VLIRTHPAELQKIEPDLYKADSILIDKLCIELSITDTTKVAHLITKIADEKKEREPVDIIFDYGVPADEVQPEVRAYCIKVNSSNLIVKDYFHPIIKGIVNAVVGLFRSQNSEEGLTFPSRTDVQRRASNFAPCCLAAYCKILQGSIFSLACVIVNSRRRLVHSSATRLWWEQLNICPIIDERNEEIKLHFALNNAHMV
jgi:hypothetical protein